MLLRSRSLRRVPLALPVPPQQIHQPARGYHQRLSFHRGEADAELPRRRGPAIAARGHHEFGFFILETRAAVVNEKGQSCESRIGRFMHSGQTVLYSGALL